MTFGSIPSCPRGMAEALIIDAVRTPRGKRKGSLAGIHAVDLAAHVLTPPSSGRASPPGGRGRGRSAASPRSASRPSTSRAAPCSPPACPSPSRERRVNRLCGSGLTAVADVASGILSGIHLGIGGGSSGSPACPWAPTPDSARTHLAATGRAVPGPHPPGPVRGAHRPEVVPRPRTARRVRGRLAGKGRGRARRRRFHREMAPIPVRDADGGPGSSRDEHPRPGTTVETLAGLKPSFREDGVIHAGNASGIVDGAAAVVVASREAARTWGSGPGRASSPPPSSARTRS